jgi:ATP-dependent DNA ligase
MLASSITEWPEGGGWALEPKYDGYRLLVEIRPHGRVCAWSRHGTSLTEPLRELLAPLGALGAGWIFDGELIALDDRAGHPAQDFAAVGRAVFGRDRAASARLHYVAFDLPTSATITVAAARILFMMLLPRLMARPESRPRSECDGSEGSRSSRARGL